MGEYFNYMEELRLARKKVRVDKAVENPKVSVVMFVRNVEEKLERCLNSLTEQTLHEIEIIITEGYSDDNTYGFCCTYAQYDKRIRLLREHFSNRYVSQKFIRGEIISFVDVEEELDRNFLEKIYEFETRKCKDIAR